MAHCSRLERLEKWKDVYSTELDSLGLGLLESSQGQDSVWVIRSFMGTSIAHDLWVAYLFLTELHYAVILA